MYGKALCQYLQSALPLTGIYVPKYCNEDWGWWPEVQRGTFSMGLCIYSDPDAAGDPERYALVPAIHHAKKWSWSKFRKVDVSQKVLELVSIVERVLKSDADIRVVRPLEKYAFD